MPDKEHRPETAKAPTTAPGIQHDQDERGGDYDGSSKNAPTRDGIPPPRQDIRTRFTQHDVVGEKTFWIRIGAGLQQGVRDGMRGYLEGTRADFIVYDTGPKQCFAKVEVSGQELITHKNVVINPSKS